MKSDDNYVYMVLLYIGAYCRTIDKLKNVKGMGIVILN